MSTNINASTPPIRVARIMINNFDVIDMNVSASDLKSTAAKVSASARGVNERPFSMRSKRLSVFSTRSLAANSG